MSAWVFGYASLVAFAEPLVAGGRSHQATPGRLRGFRRHWGAAMDNWEGGEEAKHWLDPETGKRPRIRIAYLDISHIGSEGGPPTTVNGLAIPVDLDRLAALDAREVNYERIDVSDAFEPAGTTTQPTGDSVRADRKPAGSVRPQRVFAYVGTAAARERRRRALADGDGFVARDYLAGVRAAFTVLGDDALAEFDRTTDSSPFPLADLRVINPRPDR